MAAPRFNETNQSIKSLNLLPQFNITDTMYKTVGEHEIGVTILVPKTTPPGKRPVLVRFHGGAMTEGERESFLRPWILELVLKHHSILITPDYRLRPETDWEDIMDDIRDFWTWVENNLPIYLRENYGPVEADLHDVAVTGESAGGYYTVQSGLLGMYRHGFNVLVCGYPLIDVAEHLRRLEASKEKIPLSVLESHMHNLTEQTRFLSRTPYGTRMRLAASMMMNGRFVDLSGKNAYLDPMTSLESAPPLPPIVLMHSREDESVSFTPQYIFVSINVRCVVLMTVPR